MQYAIVYTSLTGNTARLAQALRDSLPAGDCLYFGAPDAAALAAEVIDRPEGVCVRHGGLWRGPHLF